MNAYSNYLQMFLCPTFLRCTICVSLSYHFHAPSPYPCILGYLQLSVETSFLLCPSKERTQDARMAYIMSFVIGNKVKLLL